MTTIPSSAVSDRTGQKARFAVAAMFLVNGLIVGSWAPQIPALTERLGIRESTLGLLILAFGLGALIAMPSCGVLIARYSSRKVLKSIALLCAFSLVCVALVPNLWFAFPIMLLFGGLVGGMDVSMNTNAVAVEDRLGRAIMSSSHAFWSLGGFIGSASGGWLIATLGSGLHGALISAAALLIVVYANGFLISEPAHAQEDKVKLSLPRNPTIYIIGILALFSMLPEGAMLDWGALYLKQELGSDLATASLGFAAFSGSMAIMRFLGDHVRNRFGAVKTLRVSTAIAAIGLLGGSLAPTPLIAIAAFAFAGLGIANIVPILFSAAGNQRDLPPGVGMSLVTTMGYSGILVAPSAIGFIGERTGFAPIYMALAMILLIVCGLAHYAASADRS